MTVQLPPKESLTEEFKSDATRLPDRELVLAAVCLANTQGGAIWLGVEDDGRVTGIHADHGSETALAVLISNRTSPPLSVRVTFHDIGSLRVARIEVPRSQRPVASTEGTMQRRRLLADGRPECVPFLPHEIVSRESDLGLVDYSSLPVARSRLDDLDPVERHRLRQAIDRYSGDRTLLELGDEAFDGALGLVRTEGSGRVPTVAGLLLMGKEAAIRTYLPTHEVAFQHLRHHEVKANDFYRWPLVRLFERIEEQFKARVTEQEIQVGLFRVAVPSVDPRTFREAFVNALTHRDYARLGAVHVQWRDDTLAISSPGGFVDGVTQDNLLTIEPRPRNPVLADAFKRLGLSERTGRGVDLIYEGLVRTGRPSPSYAKSSATAVVVELDTAAADLGFLTMIVEHERQTHARLPLDSLLVLSALRGARRLETSEIAELTHRSIQSARAVLEALIEAGLVERHGASRSRTYTLSSAVYRQQGKAIDYVRQTGVDAIRHEEMVLRLVDTQKSIRRRDVMHLCHLDADQAKQLLRRLVDKGQLRRLGDRRAARYERV